MLSVPFYCLLELQKKREINNSRGRQDGTRKFEKSKWNLIASKSFRFIFRDCDDKPSKCE